MRSKQLRSQRSIRRLALVLCIAAFGCGDGARSDPGAVTCGDGMCSTAEQEGCADCPEDCGACGHEACGDGTCSEDGDESCTECPEDCGACVSPVCGDGACSADGAETCASCDADCGPCAACGNGICDLAESESCASCPADCGPCEACGDDVCDAATETCSSCQADCGPCEPCGDGICDEASESCSTCQADCELCAVRQGCVQGTFTAYHGNLHAHTGYSDGKRTPSHAFAAAHEAGLDFMWVTDHKGPMGAHFADCKTQAVTVNGQLAGAFVAGCGYEVDLWDAADTQRFGHFNALFLASNTTTPAGLHDMYSTLAGCDPCVGQWNHPPWPGTFDDYQFYPAGQSAMRLIELSGGGEWETKKNAYFRALRNGWRISPAANEDNHRENWGRSARATGVWATALTRVALREAVRANRTFATFDDTARIAFKADEGCWMGSRLRGAGPIALTVVARDRQQGDGFKRIDLLGKDGAALESKSCAGANPCTATFTRNPSAATFWVAQAVQLDGDVLMSAPIWLEP